MKQGKTKSMKKLMMTVAAVCAAAGAFAANVSKVERYDVDENYQATPVYSSAAHNLSEAGWYAGLKLTWDNNKQKTADTSVSITYNGQNQVSYSASTYNTASGNKAPNNSGMKNTVTSTGWLSKTYYMETTEWYVCITPEIMHSLSGTDYTATLSIGGNSYTITVPHDVVLNDGTYQWYPAVGLLGEKVYGDAQLLADAIELPNYQDVKFLVDPSGLTFPDGFAADDEVDGVWGVRMLHNHSWSFNVVDGTNLVATCGGANCPYNNGEVRMWLAVGTTEKDYDGSSVTRKAEFDEYFMDVFSEAATVLTVNEVENGTINTAGVYTVELSVTGVGGDSEPYVLSTTVTINKKDITGATLVLTPASTTYNAAEQTVTPSVTVDGLAATIEVSEGSMTAATEIGSYSVTVNGTGNFTGTTSAKWEIVNTTGEPTSVAASAAGSMTNVGNDFTLSDSSKLEYDSENKVWYAGITITWPVEKKDWQALSWTYHAYYVTEDSVRLKAENGGVKNATDTSSYKTGALSSQTKSFTYLSTTTWKVPLSPAIVEAAIAEEKSALTYTMNAGALIWGDDTEGDKDGVAFRDYTITIPLEGIKLYDENGHQVYPVQSDVDIVEEMKGAIDAVEGLDEGEKSAAKAKVDALVEVADGDAKEVRDWIEEKTDGDYGALAGSDYIVASYVLDTEDLITDESEVEVVGLEQVAGGFFVSVTIDGADIEAARVKAASVIQSAASLEDGEFVPLNAERIDVKEDKVTISVDPAADCEFFKIVIKKDTAE